MIFTDRIPSFYLRIYNQLLFWNYISKIGLFINHQEKVLIKTWNHRSAQSSFLVRGYTVLNYSSARIIPNKIAYTAGKRQICAVVSESVYRYEHPKTY